MTDDTRVTPALAEQKLATNYCNRQTRHLPVDLPAGDSGPTYSGKALSGGGNCSMTMPKVQSPDITKRLRVQARDSWIAEAEANARLIAAAPDLLAACIGIVASQPGTSNRHFDAARAAIAKATQ